MTGDDCRVEIGIGGTVKIAAIVVGMFIAALAYLEYQRILSINWDKIQSASQNGMIGLQMS
jgi:uncharacterized membrane protein (Fun14 family)